MEFFIAERDGLTMIVAENISTNAYWYVYIKRYSWGFSDERPSMKSLNGMKIRYITDKEAISILKKHAIVDDYKPTDTRKVLERIREFIDLPF